MNTNDKLKKLIIKSSYFSLTKINEYWQIEISKKTDTFPAKGVDDKYFEVDDGTYSKVINKAYSKMVKEWGEK